MCSTLPIPEYLLKVKNECAFIHLIVQLNIIPLLQSCMAANFDTKDIKEHGQDGSGEKNVDMVILIGATQKGCGKSTIAYASSCRMHGKAGRFKKIFFFF